MPEELREVANVGVVNGEMIIDVTAWIKAEGDHDPVKGLVIGKCRTDCNPGDR